MWRENSSSNNVAQTQNTSMGLSTKKYKNIKKAKGNQLKFIYNL